MITFASSVRVTGLAACLMIPCGVAQAQDPAATSARNGGAGIRAGNITATGETVPNPGASQGGGTTSMDKGIERKDTEIETSICKGC